MYNAVIVNSEVVGFDPELEPHFRGLYLMVSLAVA
jgi:hypothetical protein